MSRLQLALNVNDLDEAICFYSKLFGTEPAKVRTGYANFAVEQPPLKLVLVQDASRKPGSLNHLGVEVGSAREVAAERARLSAAGLDTAVGDQVACCYAVQDKVWVSAPGGEPWEIYTVLGEADTPPGSSCDVDADGAPRCASRPDLESAGLVASSCC